MCWTLGKWQSLVIVPTCIYITIGSLHTYTHSCTHTHTHIHIHDIVLMYTAYFNDVVVGAVCCRVETEGDKHRMYIMTLGCLAPYRRLGVGMCNV